MSSYSFVLAGNQNCGKTTLFNALTGAAQKVGNFPGVTIEKKTGTLKNRHDVGVTDLPGIYSLSPYSPEEIIARDYIIENRPECIINVLDATNLSRGLYLTLQVLELGLPTVVALNMMDEITQNGFVIDIKGIEKELGAVVVPISASRNTGIENLINAALDAARGKKTAGCTFYKGPVHRALAAIGEVIGTKAKAADLPVLYAAAGILEGDRLLEKRLQLNKAETANTNHAAKAAETALMTDRETVMAQARYEFIDNICGNYCKRGDETIRQKSSDTIDSILVNRFFALPILFAVMMAVFWLTFSVIGPPLSELLGQGIAVITNAAGQLLTDIGTNSFLTSLVIDGIFAGVGSILSFLPVILVLFFLLSILEDTGYMARAAFIMDRPMRAMGLSGRAFVPLLLGFGCSVPAVMATRTLPGARERKMTILLVPFMSCSAKLPIYAVIAGVFFPENAAAIVFFLYLLGIAVAVCCGLFYKQSTNKEKRTTFLLELPPYRFMSLKNAFIQMIQRAKDFIKKAFTVILLASVAVWLLQSFDTHFALTDNAADSILAAIGRTAAPLFAPLGFADWRIAAALITGLTAKETVISTLSVLIGVSALDSALSPPAALALMAFTLLYMPCAAAFAVIKRELGSPLGALAAMAAQTGIAWLVSFAVYHTAALFF